MMPRLAISAGLLAAWAAIALAGEPVSFDSPGFPPTRMDAEGRLIEDWGTVGVKLSGEGVSDGPVAVQAIRLDGVVPAARARSNRGAIRATWTAFRAPAFPSGVDVLSIRLEETKGRPARITVALDVPSAVKAGLTAARLDKRVVVGIPEETLYAQQTRDWGYMTEAQAMPGWAKPEGRCDPAFANIRAGMGGVPIVYRFKVDPGSRPGVALGFCESHWAAPGKRPLQCRVEGARWQDVDPVGKWGQHKPGVLWFRARDVNVDGLLDVAVHPVPSAADRNTILNAIWLFDSNKAPDLAKVVTGELNSRARRYVDVGGKADQALFASENLAYPVVLPAGGAVELNFFLACKDGTAPFPPTSTWTPAALRAAAADVWRTWQKP